MKGRVGLIRAMPECWIHENVGLRMQCEATGGSVCERQQLRIALKRDDFCEALSFATRFALAARACS
jgi:hypothetical protein